MTRHPGAAFIPAAFLLPGWFIRAAVNIIETAVDAWEDAADTWDTDEEEEVS